MNPHDTGFMYWHAFRDLDGHCWELAYMDAAAGASAESEERAMDCEEMASIGEDLERGQ